MTLGPRFCEGSKSIANKGVIKVIQSLPCVFTRSHITSRHNMPRLRMRSEVYGSVFVCVCVDCYSCSRINEVSKTFYRLLVTFS